MHKKPEKNPSQKEAWTYFGYVRGRQCNCTWQVAPKSAASLTFSQWLGCFFYSRTTCYTKHTTSRQSPSVICFLQFFNLLEGAVVTPNLLSCGIFSYRYPGQWDIKAGQGPWQTNHYELHRALQSGQETWPGCQVLTQVTDIHLPLLLRLWKHWDPPIHIQIMKEKCLFPVRGRGHDWDCGSPACLTHLGKHI